MKKMIFVLVISLLFVALFSSGAFAESFAPAEEAPQDAPVGWGVFSLPAEPMPQSFESSSRADPTGNPPTPSIGLSQPDAIRNDYPSASAKSPEVIEQEILDRCLGTAPVILISTVPVPYIPIGEIDTNY